MFPLLISILGMVFVLRDARAQSVTQPDNHISVSEGASLELRCTYSYTGTVYLYWYVQDPSQGLQLLLKYYSGDTLVKGIKNFEAELRKNESTFNLRKHFAHWSDSAEYFCAVSATVLGTA
ncbi:T-cell receptor alpha chain V region PHDS58 [Myotis brandtii]|nr:T-cell receptor alpha chain V region PHDS58 [Myotis brandtii]